ncbi:MAG: 16S rRNA (cytosine(1402)-N(4))-methyltransferase RsmH [Patescibacteria group bacterium]|nr:16S rRNA (cytosine(1402)-N(4))-methyltransferase RsmH [Patescibacteria group bacterium]
MHIPVLQKEVLKYLTPKPNENFIDATIGGGGHAFSIIKRILPKGKLLGIDQDPEQIENCKLSRPCRVPTSVENPRFPIGRLSMKSEKIENFKKRVILVCDNFSNLKEIVEREKFWPIDGILFDLGLSSWHLEKSGRGFTFQKNEPLDMRYDNKNQKSLTAEEIVNKWSEREIEEILREYGQERFSRRIAREIIRERQKEEVKTTFQLIEIIKKATPTWYHYRKIHPATKTFQALRLVVNDELENLKKALPQALTVLKNRGRLTVISFHSLEDKIVKNFFRENHKKGRLKILTKKPVLPTRGELQKNRRARSAKLRAGMKIEIA